MTDTIKPRNSSDDLVERVARAMWMADVEPYDPANRIPFEQAPEGAQAYCRAEASAAIAVCMEEAAKVCDEIEITEYRKWKQHADMLAQGASGGAGDCAATIRSLTKETTNA